MYRVGIWLCIVAIWAHSITGQTPPTQLVYDCDTSGKVTIHSDGLDGYSSIYARGKINNSDGDCTVRTLQSPVKFEITMCKPDAPITVVILKIPNQDQSNGQVGSPGTTLGSKSFVIGGSGLAAYSLTCYVESAVADSNSKLPSAFAVMITGALPIKSTISPKAEEYNVAISMSIRKGDGISLGPSDKIALGESLLVVISGPAGPIYFVKECHAYDPDAITVTSIQLILAGKPSNDKLMTTFVNIDPAVKVKVSTLCSTAKTCEQSTLYAFHFKDTNKVTLECSIEVCNSASVSECQSTRSRREAEPNLNNGTDVRTLSETITVYDSLQREPPAATAGSTRNPMVFGMMLALFGFAWISK